MAKKYIDAEKLIASLEQRKKQLTRWTDKDYADQRIDEIDCILDVDIDSLQQESIEKDEDAEKLILCDILEATIARINGGKVDKEKEENIMMEKINYLRNLGLKGE